MTQGSFAPPEPDDVVDRRHRRLGTLGWLSQLQRRRAAWTAVVIAALAAIIVVAVNTVGDGGTRTIRVVGAPTTGALTSTASPITSTAATDTAPTTTVASTTTTAGTEPTSPSTTIVKNTLIRYWGSITAPYNDSDFGLQLTVPPAGTRPKVSWQQAAEPCNRVTGTDNCAVPTTPEDVFLAVATVTDSGGPLLLPLNHTLAYVIGETDKCPATGGGSSYTPSSSRSGTTSTTTTSTTTQPVSSTPCTTLTFVNANTGAGGMTISGGDLRFPPHGE